MNLGNFGVISHVVKVSTTHVLYVHSLLHVVTICHILNMSQLEMEIAMLASIIHGFYLSKTL